MPLNEGLMFTNGEETFSDANKNFNIEDNVNKRHKCWLTKKEVGELFTRYGRLDWFTFCCGHGFNSDYLNTWQFNINGYLIEVTYVNNNYLKQIAW